MFYYIILQRGDVYKVEEKSASKAYEKCRKRHIETYSADILDIVDEDEYNKKYADRYAKPII